MERGNHAAGVTRSKKTISPIKALGDDNLTGLRLEAVL